MSSMKQDSFPGFSNLFKLKQKHILNHKSKLTIFTSMVRLPPHILWLDLPIHVDGGEYPKLLTQNTCVLTLLYLMTGSGVRSYFYDLITGSSGGSHKMASMLVWEVTSLNHRK